MHPIFTPADDLHARRDLALTNGERPMPAGGSGVMPERLGGPVSLTPTLAEACKWPANFGAFLHWLLEHRGLNSNDLPAFCQRPGGWQREWEEFCQRS